MNAWHSAGPDSSMGGDSRAEPPKRPILMVGPIPLDGSYIGGIGVSMKRLMKYWSLAIPVLHLNTECRRRTYGSTGKLRLANLGGAIANLLRLSVCILRTRPAIVHYHTSRGLALVKDMVLVGWSRFVLRRKIILHLRSSDPVSILMSKSPRWQRFQLRVLRRCCDRLVFLSENVVDAFATRIGPIHSEAFRAQCTVLPNFTLHRVSQKRHDGLGRSVHLFYIGNVGREKGIHDLIIATSRLKGTTGLCFRVFLAGPFDNEQEEHIMRQAVKDHGLEREIVFLGSVHGERKEAAFLQADIFVLPSYSEGIPQSMLEAMAYGLPVVVSRIGGIPEVVRDGQEGIIVRPGDIPGLCSALAQLIVSVDCRHAMGMAARRRVAQEYTVETYMERLQVLYDSLLVQTGVS